MIPEIADMMSRRRPVRFGARAQIKPRSKLDFIDRKATLDLAERHVKFTRDLFALLPGPGLTAILNQSRERGKSISHPEGCQCGDHSEPVTKALTPAEITDIEGRFFALDPALSIQIDRLADEFSKDMARPAGNSTGIYNRFAATAVPEIMRVSLYVIEQARPKTVKKSVSLTRLIKPLGAILPPDPKLMGNFILEMQASGFDLVTSKITELYLPQAKEIIINGLQSKKSWQEIKYLLKNEIGVGKTWHWRRLVTTEMSIAIDRINRKQYQEAGAEYMKYSASVVPCPICEGHARKNGGYYRLSEAPRITEDTHPLCRCVNLPVFNLPMGITV